MQHTKKSDFLTKLQNAGLEKVNRLPEKQDATFKFCFRQFGHQFYVDTVDNELQHIEVNPSDCVGNEQRAAALLEQAKLNGLSLWDEALDTSKITKVALADHPELMYPLLNCDNLCLQDGTPLTLSNNREEASVVLTIGEADGQPGFLKGSFALDIKGTRSSECELITDSFALDGNTILLIEPVGHNFDKLHVFSELFEIQSLDTYIGLVLTYFKNIKIDYEGKRIRILSEEACSEPTLVVERIDPDKTLVLRVSGTAAGTDNFVQEHVGIDYQVQVGEYSITAKRIKHLDNEAMVKDVLERIRKCASGHNNKIEVVAFGDNIYVPEATASVFLLEGLPSLLRDYKIIGLERLKNYKVRPINPIVKAKIGSGIDFLDIDAEIQLGDETFTLQKFLDAYNNKRYIALKDGSRAVVDAEFVKQIERIFRTDKHGKSTVSFFDIPELERLLDPSCNKQPGLKRIRSFYENLSKLGEEELQMPPINAELRKYQVEGFKWLHYLYQNDMGGCLADDMGLGKTVQIIALLTAIYPQEVKPTLIVMPRSLLFNWECELKKFAPHIDYHIYYGPDRKLKTALKHNVVLTTYGVVRSDIEALSKVKFHMAVLDESQTIKNVNSLQARSVFMLQADKRFALSGTPLENNLAELYSLFRFLNPGMFGTLNEFTQTYIIPIQKNDDMAVAQALRRKIFPFMLRRMKKDVLTDLPDRVDQTVFVEMDPDMESYYNLRKRYYRDRIRINIAEDGIQKSQFAMLQAITELRRIASVPEILTDGKITSPKLEAVTENVANAVENGHKVVVFFNFIAGVEIIGQRLRELGIDFAEITGSTRDRSSQVNRFQNDPDCKVILMTLKVGAVGLNLTAADMVYIVEPWWNKAAEEQAISRLHRLGQKSTVFCLSYITHNTIEEKIRQLQQMKAHLFDSVISNDESIAKNFTEEDIQFILS